MYKNGLTMSTDKKNIYGDNWITQAEAARIRGVSRQAIGKLVKKARLKTLIIGKVIFVDKMEIENYQILTSGRPKKDMNG
jgi:hypothetical protein